MKESAVESKSDFKKGLKDGVPIALGYFPVAFACGVAAAKTGLVLWLSQLMSCLIYTGSGQFAILNLIQGGEMVLFTYALTIFIVNCRYVLLSLALSQRLDPDMGIFQRMLFSFFNTDEIFAIVTQQKGNLKSSYLFGIATLPYISWALGTLIGTLFTDIMPLSISTAMGIIIYAMFIAIIVPALKTSKPVLYVVMISVLLSVVMECTPVIKNWLSSGWIIIICTVMASLVGALLFPINKEEEQ